MKVRSSHRNGRAKALRRGLGSVAIAAGVSLLTNCGTDEGAGGTSDTADDELIVDDQSRGGGTWDDGVAEERDGGRTDLTSDQVQAILDAECTGWSREGEPLPATLQLVVDTSGSMTDSPPGDDDRSKWDITREALEEAVAGLPASTNLGVLFYPNKNVTSNGHTPGPVDACVRIDAQIPIAPLGGADSKQRDAFARGLSEASIESYTATHDAYSYALEEILEPYEGPNKFVLLITDGAPTIERGCTWPGDEEVSGELWDGAGSYDGVTSPIVSSIAAAQAEGIRTYLIGAPGSEESVESGTDKRPWLSEAALAGGTAAPGCTIDGPNYCHFDMTQETDFSESLASALQAIRGQIIDSCTFALPTPPPGVTLSPDLTQVIVEWGHGSSSLIHPDGNGSCTDGWEYDEDEGTISLCPKTCEEIKADTRARLFFSFGCKPEEIDGVWK